MALGLTGSQTLTQAITPGTNFGNDPLSTDGWYHHLCIRFQQNPTSARDIFAFEEDGSSADLIGLSLDSGASEPTLRFEARRGGGGVDIVNAANSVGVGDWHVVTGWIRQGSSAGRWSLSIWVNGALVVELLDERPGGLGTSDPITLAATGFNQLRLGPIDDGASIAGVAWGTGNPAAMHAHVWNSGSIQEVTSYDFASDSDCTLEGYWAFDKEATGNVSNAEPEAQDTEASLDTWTYTGAPSWNEDPAPFNSSVIPESATLGTPEATNGTTITITATLPTNSWNVPSVDATKITAYSTDGYGKVPVSSASVSVGTGASTGVATVTINLGRTIYDDEPVELDLETDWLRDDDANTGPIAAAEAVTMTNAASGPPATTTGVSKGRLWVQFADAETVFRYANGEWGVVGPVSITETGPVETTYDYNGTPYSVHGAMLNPVRTSSQLDQGFDERDVAAGFGNYWDDTRKIASYPQAMVAGDSLAKAFCRDEPEGEDSGDFIFVDSYLTLHCVSAAPSAPANTLPPPLVGYDSGATRPQHVVDLDEIVSSLPSYSLATVTANAKTPAQIITRWCQPCVGRYMGRDVGGRFFVPLRFTARASDENYAAVDGYGRELVQTTAWSIMHLLGDQATTAQKRELLAWTLAHGVHMYYGTTALGEPIITPGAHDQGFVGAVAWMLKATNQTAAMATLLDDFGYNELHQPFYHTPATIAGRQPHDTEVSSSYDGNNIWMAKRQEVTANNRITLNETGIAWDNSTNRLTKAGAFASYNHLTSGDQVQITGGTGFTAGWYAVADKINNDTIELADVDVPDTSDVDIGLIGSSITGTLPQGDLVYRSNFEGAVCINETTGNTWDVINHGRFSPHFALESGHDVQVGHTVYFNPAYDWEVGDPDWSQNPTQFPSGKYSNNSTYRPDNEWSTQALLIEQLQLKHVVQNADAMVDYVRRANLPDEPQGFDFSPSYELEAVEQFWAAHNLTIQAVQANIDTTAPTLTSPGGTATGTTTANATVTTDEDDGTLYVVPSTSSTPPSAAQVIAGENAAGQLVAASESQAVSQTGQQTVALTGLTAETTYYFHFVHVDAADNESAVSTSAGVTTQAPAVAPTVASARRLGTSIVLKMSRAVTVGAGGSGGFAMSGVNNFTVIADGDEVVLTARNGSDVPIEVPNATLSYTQPGNGIEADDDGTDLASFTGLAVPEAGVGTRLVLRNRW